MARSGTWLICAVVFVLFILGHVSFFRFESGGGNEQKQVVVTSRGYGINELRRRVRSHRDELQRLTNQVNDANKRMRSDITASVEGVVMEEQAEIEEKEKEEMEIREDVFNDVVVADGEQQEQQPLAQDQQQNDQEEQDGNEHDLEQEEDERGYDGHDRYIDAHEAVPHEESDNNQVGAPQENVQKEQQQQQPRSHQLPLTQQQVNMKKPNTPQRIATTLENFRRLEWVPLATNTLRAAPTLSDANNITLAHLLNPLNAPPGSEMAAAQHITFATIAVSQLYAEDNVHVDIITAQFEQDLPVLVPPSFRPVHNLELSSMDVIQDAAATKQLPLVRELLMAAYNNTAASHIIFSNLDIAVMPSFYANVQSLLKCDQQQAFAINRVEIPGGFTVDTMEEMYETVPQYRQKHPGFDCFVIPRRVIPQVAALIGDVYLGYPPVGQHLRSAILSSGIKFTTYTGFHRTFHLGHKNGNWGGYQGGGVNYQYHNWQAAARSATRRRSGVKYVLNAPKLRILQSQCGFHTEYPENPTATFLAMPEPETNTTTHSTK